MFRSPARSLLAIVTLLAAVAAARPVLAGPPLLCHPFDIGSARSLPWDGARGWSDGRADYKLSSLVADTEAILTPSTPVIVRMETLRRAAIYASGDGPVMKQLFTSLMHRAQASERSGRPDALAFLDAAYLAGALRQIGQLNGTRERAGAIRAVIGDTDAYTLITKALSARGHDPAMHFAAALIAADRNRAAYEEHARRARGAAGGDVLLARNIRKLS